MSFCQMNSKPDFRAIITLHLLVFLLVVASHSEEFEFDHFVRSFNSSDPSHSDIIVCPKITSVLLFTKPNRQWILSKNQVSLISERNLEHTINLLKEDGNERGLHSAFFFQPQNLSFIQSFKPMMKFFYQNPNGKYDDQLLLYIYWPENSLGRILKENTEKVEDERESEKRNAPYLSLKSLALSFPLNSRMQLITPFPSTENKSANESIGMEKETMNYLIWDVFSIKNVSIIQKLNQNSNKPLSLTRTNWQKVPVIAASVGIDKSLNDPVAGFSYSNETGEVTFTRGASVRILNDLADFFNFSVKARLSDSYISVFPNGTLDGDGQLLNSGEADISIYLEYITKARSQYLQPLFPICRDSIHVFFLRPPSNSVRNIFTQPFSDDLWLAIIVTVCLMYISMFLIVVVQKETCPENYLQTSLRLNDLLIWILSVMCQQSYLVTNWVCSQKIVLISSLLTSLALYTAYCCSIISTLTFDGEPIKNVEDLLEQDFKMLAEPDVPYVDFLFNDSQAGQRDIYAHKLDNYTNDLESVKKIYDGEHAFLSVLDVVGPLSRVLDIPDHRICSTVSSIPLKAIQISCGFHIAKGSPFKEHFNVKLLQIMEKGLNAKYFKNLYDETKPKCCGKPKSYQKISIYDVFSAFILLFSGVILSVTMLIVERSSFIHALLLPFIFGNLRRFRENNFRRKRKSILIYISQH